MVRYTRAFCVACVCVLWGVLWRVPGRVPGHVPGRVPGRVPGVFGLCRDLKKLCRDLKNISKSISQTWYTRYSTRRLFVGIFFTFREFILILYGAV